MSCTFMSRVTRAFGVLSLVLAAGAMVVSLGATPAAAEIDDTPQNNFWGLSGQGPAQTNNFNAQAWAIEQIGNIVYVGGKFTDVRGGGVNYPRPYLAAFEASTGRWLDWWTPDVNAPVYALRASPDGTTLFVGGEFTSVNGVQTPAFAAIDPLTGENKPGWTTRVSGGGPAGVKEIKVGPDGLLYIVGNFTTVAKNGATQPAYRATRINPSTGDIDSNWKPLISGGGVWDVAFGSGRVYLGGYFTSVNNRSGTRAFAPVNTTNGGAVTGVFGYTPNLTSTGRVHAVAAVNDLVFVAGEEHATQVLFASTLGRKFVHYTGQPANQGWALQGGGDFQDLEVVGDRVYAACHCWNQHLEAANGNLYPTTSPGPGTWAPVRSVVAYDAFVGDRIDSFAPILNGSSGVWTMMGHSTDGCLWLGGQLTQSGGVAANNLVRLCDAAGPGPAAGPPVPDPTDPPPPAPANCSSTLQGTDIALTWAPSAGAERYVIRRSRDGGAPSWLASVNVPAVSLVNSATAAGSTYSYSVEAVGGSGVSAPTSCGAAITVPTTGVGVPSNCTTAVAGANLTTSWNAVAGASYYIVRRSRDGGTNWWLARVNAPSTSYVRPTPSAAGIYTYTVEAVAPSGTRSDPASCGTIDLIPGGGGAAVAPVSCVATQSAARTYVVSWNRAANDNAVDFIVRRSRDGGPFGWAGRISVPGTSFTNTSVPLGSSYSYTVTARAADGSVAITNCTTQVLGGGGPAVAPVSCSATALSASSVRVSWAAAANDNATDYIMRRSRNGNGFSWAGRVPAPGASFDNTSMGSGTYLYTVEARAADGSVAVANCGPVGGVVL